MLCFGNNTVPAHKSSTELLSWARLFFPCYSSCMIIVTQQHGTGCMRNSARFFVCFKSLGDLFTYPRFVEDLQLLIFVDSRGQDHLGFSRAALWTVLNRKLRMKKETKVNSKTRERSGNNHIPTTHQQSLLPSGTVQLQETCWKQTIPTPPLHHARTTMMAILPPTSPTTVIGGFSLAIITKEERNKRSQLALSQTATAPLRVLQWCTDTVLYIILVPTKVGNHCFNHCLSL